MRAALAKAAFDSTPAINAVAPLSKSAAAPKLLDSKTTLSPTESALDLQKIPPDKKKITCLTIGSRGDVQPYIALCQGLIEKGHACTIATHEKFRDWIIQSGVAFRPVAGDPEELIKHCTKNVVLFLVEREEKGSSWEAAQGSELLIESPSVMVGAHIAQSLNIPYIRAFTMPWTKTGVYPHAMAAMGTYWGEWMNKLT
ncbi:hypothetical protein PGTUg99_002580 [Puccinia graminis f. sp. tritici]|uniref:Glycosyltransferase family 28 N-terminal domain-containing protein n=1 Tax=Puccinia graminis f. sp. tritici TaxID=56615 RepID=A0A5B0NR54_PUCGR|nr:hypothetical protein PGTUg99_002580 [Puccinia graminis f. sp. tritici]